MQNMSVLTMKPLGQQLVEAGLLTQEQLDTTLQAQKSQPDKLLGQILVEKQLLTQQEFDQFMQNRMSIQQPLGELLVDKEAITREQLNKALSVQMQLGPTAKPLGQLLVDQGAIDQAALDDLIQQQYAEQETLRKKLTVKGQEQSRYERSQVEDIQNLLSTGIIFLALGKELMPDDSRMISERFAKLDEQYQGERLALEDEVRDAAGSFMIHFLPMLEQGFTLEGPQTDVAEERNQIVNQGFFALMEAFQKLLLPEMRLFSNYYLNSLIMTDANDIISLRESLYIAARSSYLMPHGSLMALRFLLNEFWGQRSILEESGYQIVRNEEDIDLSDYFRPRLDDMEDDLRYVEYMESHIFDQIEYNTNLLRDSRPEELGQRVIELMELYHVLLQTHKDWKETQQQELEESAAEA